MTGLEKIESFYQAKRKTIVLTLQEEAMIEPEGFDATAMIS